MAYIAIRRFLELLLPEVVVSALISLLVYAEVIPEWKWLVQVIYTVLILLYFVYQFSMLRLAYVGVGDIGVYTSANLAASMTFLLINSICFLLLSSEMYTWFFAMFKVLHYYNFTGVGVSAIIAQGMAVMLIFAAPFGLSPAELAERE